MRAPRGSQRLFWNLLFLALVAAGLYLSYLFYSTVKEIVACAQFPVFSEWRTSFSSSGEGEAQEPEAPLLPGKEERVNILLLGIDKRKVERGPSRTDTIILASIDPQTRTAAMLSIPRDLWVPIPGYGEGRINKAYFLGEVKKYPGGGPALAKKTVSYNLGVPVHYYVLVNFEGFVKIVDALGGIDIYVEKEIRDDKFPDEAYGYEPLYIPAGLQHMDGELALKYARTRHVDDDIGRARRQQQVLFAIRDKALRLNILPKLPSLLNALADTVETDMQPREILRLAQIASKIRREDIKTAIIDYSMTMPWTTPTGERVLIPLRDRIRPLIDELFIHPTPTTPREEATIFVQNGTTVEGLAARTAAFLKEHGYKVAGFGNADRHDYAYSLIIVRTGKRQAANALAQFLSIPQEHVQSNPQLDVEADLVLILGMDFQLPAK